MNDAAQFIDITEGRMQRMQAWYDGNDNLGVNVRDEAGNVVCVVLMTTEQAEGLVRTLVAAIVTTTKESE